MDFVMVYNMSYNPPAKAIALTTGHQFLIYQIILLRIYQITCMVSFPLALWHLPSIFKPCNVK